MSAPPCCSVPDCFEIATTRMVLVAGGRNVGAHRVCPDHLSQLAFVAEVIAPKASERSCASSNCQLGGTISEGEGYGEFPGGPMHIPCARQAHLHGFRSEV